ncbi:MAG: NAD(P)/FAD-dependent oxidoreductase [Bauldia litoralis]
MTDTVETAKPIDPSKLEKALASADLRVLLMVMFHMTGDRTWLEEPYLPKRDVALIPDRNAGFDEVTQAEIRAAALDILTGTQAPAVRDPGDDLMHEMMSKCLGERKIEPGYATMMREEVGFASRFAKWTDAAVAKEKAADREMLVGIVGAGTAGIILANHLERLGVDYVIFDKADEVGGTWHVHRYPGCAVDTPNHAYSFSFGSRYRWTRYFSPREQLEDYVIGIAKETGVWDKVRLNTTVEAVTWDETRKKWDITVSSKGERETVEVDVFVSGVGQLNDPMQVHFKGEESFKGEIFHPIDWPDDLDISGKKVAVVGTGASAMQIVPAIVDEVEELQVYQRTPQWARPIPRFHDPIGEDQQWLLDTVPFYADWFRLTMLWRYGDGLHPTLRKDPNWPTPTRSVNKINERHRVEMEDYIKSELADRPDLIEKCIPDFPPYGKRILLDAGWFKAIKKPNAELVTEGIDHIEENAIVTKDGERREADIIVVSTGYRINRMTARLNVTGRDGVKLEDVWGEDDPKAYKSITVPGFPNMFVVYGPNTGLAHGGSSIFMNECGGRYIANFIVRMVEDDLQVVEATQEATEEYTARVDAEHESLVWSAEGLNSYYRNKHGRVTSACPWRLIDYWSMTREADPEVYRTEKLESAPEKATATG